MRIALTIHALFGGGAERLMSQLATRWANAGHDVHLITWADQSTDGYALPSNVQRHSLQLMRSSRNRLHGLWSNWQRVRNLRSKLNEIAPDVVLSFCDQMNIVTLEAARKLSAPVWIAEHSDPSKQLLPRVWQWWRARTYPHCNGCIALTPAIEKVLSRWVPREKLVVIPNAIEPPGVVSNCDQPQQSESQNLKTVLAVGRLRHEKGVDLLLEAWRTAHPALSDWRLRIAGDGPERRALEQLASGLPRVEFLGWVDDPWPLYREADIFVMPSRYEGFPVALLEAMSQRVACIATHCTDAVEILSASAECLELLPVESSSALNEALRRLANSSSRRKKLAESGQSVSRHYTWDTIGPDWDRLIEVSHEG